MEGTSPVPGTRVSRADYGRVVQMEENHYKGSTVREEHKVLQEKLNMNREMFKDRGRTLRAEREATAQRVAASKGNYQQQASKTREDMRAQLESLRRQRELNDLQHRTKGREKLTKQADLQKHIRNEAVTRQAESRAMATEIKTRSKEREKSIGERRLAEKSALAEHVRQCAGRDTTRTSKMYFINDRWDQADSLREQMEALRDLKRRQTHEYLAMAAAKREELRQVHRETAQEQEAAMKRQGEEQRRKMKAMQDAIAASKTAEDERKKKLHESMYENKLVPEQQIEHETTVNKDTLGAAFARFFGFRQRGVSASSVTL